MTDRLDGLTDEALRDLHARVVYEVERRGQAGDASKDQQIEGRYLTAMNQVLRDLRLTECSYPLLIRRRDYRKFQQAAHEAERWFDQHVASTAVERVALTGILLKMSARYLTKCRVPISATSLIQQLGQPGKIVEDQLPGYSQSGLLTAALLRKAFE